MEFVSQPDKLLNKLMLKALLTVQLIGPETEYDKHYFPCLIRFHDVLLIMFFSGGKNAEDDIVIDENNPWKGKSSKSVCKCITLFQLVFKSIWLQDLLIQPRLRRGLDHPLLILLFYIYSKGLDHPNLHSRPAWIYHLLDHGLQKWWRIIYQFKVQIKDTGCFFTGPP